MKFDLKKIKISLNSLIFPMMFMNGRLNGTVSSVILLGIANDKLKLYGVQFHPEVDLTENGMAIFQNFLFNIAGCVGNFTMSGREAACVSYIKETTGNHKVLVSQQIQFIVSPAKHSGT